MRISCCGGTGEEGRSCLWFEAEGVAPLMVDCGVKREFSPGHPGRYPLLPGGLPHSFPLLLTHAHEDHVAAIPWLIANGFSPRVYATRQSVRLGPDYCRTWLKAVDKAIAESGGARPYTEEHIDAIDWRLLEDGAQDIDGWEVTHGPAAHMPGSIWFRLGLESESVCVSGDWNPASLLYPEPSFPECSLFVTDASGGMRDSDGLKTLAELAPRSREIPVLLPLPRLGRCQEMLGLLARLPALAGHKHAVAMEKPLVAAMDVWLEDTSLTGKGRADLERARGYFSSGIWLTFSAIEELPPGPRLIGAMDAMLSAGNSPALSHNVLAEGGLVLFSGHAAAGTPGRKLLDAGRPDVIRLPWKIHPNRSDVRRAFASTGAGALMLVHTPLETAQDIAREIRGANGAAVYAPSPGDTVEFAL